MEAIQIDVTDQQSVDTASTAIGKKTEVLDVLINNAGISGGRVNQSATNTDISFYKVVFETNFFGVVRVTQAFIDLLKKSLQPRIVNVSSAIASLALHSDPTWKFYHNKGAVYHSSKVALNMYRLC